MEDRKWANKSRFGGFAQLASSDMKPKPKLRPKSARGYDLYSNFNCRRPDEILNS